MRWWSRVKKLRWVLRFWLGGGGLLVAVEGPGHVVGLVGSDLVVDSAVGVCPGCELDSVVAVSVVEVLAQTETVQGLYV